MSCAFAHHDAAYVLGALPSVERREFEEHLEGCPACQEAVRALAGVPGLLAKVPPEVWESHETQVPVPPSLLSGALARRRLARRRRAARIGGLAAAAVALVALGGATTAALRDGSAEHPPVTAPTATVSTAPDRAMQEVGRTDMSARVALTGVRWGTRIDLTCSYPHAEAAEGYPAETYLLVVRTLDGREEQVATWHPPGLPSMRLAAATGIPLDRIAAVEVRSADGAPLLRLHA